MITEQCAICDATVSFADTVHVLLNTKSDAGVIDYYVCTDCYDADLAPLFPDPEPTDADADAEPTDADADAEDSDDDDGSDEERTADEAATDGAGPPIGPARE